MVYSVTGLVFFEYKKGEMRGLFKITPIFVGQKRNNTFLFYIKYIIRVI